MFRSSLDSQRKNNGKYLSIQTGSGIDLAKVGKRLSKKYAPMAQTFGIDKTVKKTLKESLPTIEQKLKQAGVPEKVIVPISSAVNKQLGKGMIEKYGMPSDSYDPAILTPMLIKGSGFFDDLISTLAVLPIPGVSCIARTVAIVKTAVDTATSDEPVKAFGGVVSDLAENLNKMVPAPLKLVTDPAEQFVKSVGFGMVDPSHKETIVKVGVKHISDLLNNIDTKDLPRDQANKVLSAQKSAFQAYREINRMK